MSAAEKLKALGVWTDRGWDSGPFDICFRDQAEALHEALPQIVAVVEAAEREHPEPHNYIEFETGITECPTCAALAALDEALGEQ